MSSKWHRINPHTLLSCSMTHEILRNVPPNSQDSSCFHSKIIVCLLFGVSPCYIPPSRRRQDFFLKLCNMKTCRLLESRMWDTYYGRANKNVLKKTARICYARLPSLLISQTAGCHKPIPLEFTFISRIYISGGSRGVWSYRYRSPVLFTLSQEGENRSTIRPLTSHEISKGSLEVKLYSFFNLSAGWGWTINAKPRPLHPRKYFPWGLVGPMTGLDGCGKSYP